MTPEQKIIVQTTFAQVTDADAVASTFYARLFEIAPEVTSLFKGDMSEQGKKLMQTLAVVVNGLDDLSAIVPAVQALGKRHVAYGVKAEHYDLVGSALLWTLAQAFGKAFTDDVQAAWATAYGIVAETAITAAYGEASV
jgi:nitric oxide dioxygenase